MVGRTNAGGGGGGATRLKVVAYASAFPTTAKDNTIGIITSTPIKGVYAGISAPTGLTSANAGAVWIKTSSYSATPIPISKNVYLYPAHAFQWLSVSGTYQWASVSENNVKCYQSGWKALQMILFDYGTSYVNWSLQSRSSIESTYIKVHDGTLQSWSAVCTESLIDVSGFTRLCCVATYYPHSNANVGYIGFNTTAGSITAAAPDISSGTPESTSKTETVTFSLAVPSGTSTAAIKIYFQHSASKYEGTFYIYKVWME